MKKSLVVLFRRSTFLLYQNSYNQRHVKLTQLQPIYTTLQQCLCTNSHCQSIDKLTQIESNNLDSSKLKKKAKRARKKLLLDGTASILKDPGVPDPQKMERSNLIDLLASSAVLHHDVIALNKPPGLPISGSKKSGDEVTFISLLSEVSDAIGHPSAEIVKGPEREMSGLLLLGHNKSCAGELAEVLSAAKRSRKLCRRFWAVTLGIPSQEQGIINEPIGYEKIGDQLQAVIRHDPSKGSFRRKSVPDWKPAKKTVTNKHAETHYNVICSNEELNCALVEIKIHSAHKHQLQVHLMHRLHPVLGDHIYSSRIGKLLGVPIHLDPHEVLPATQNLGNQLKKALHLRSGLLHMLPLHLHWYDVTLPKWKDNKDVCIRVPPPEYFWKTLQLLNLSPPLLGDS